MRKRKKAKNEREERDLQKDRHMSTIDKRIKASLGMTHNIRLDMLEANTMKSKSVTNKIESANKARNTKSVCENRSLAGIRITSKAYEGTTQPCG